MEENTNDAGASQRIRTSLGDGAPFPTAAKVPNKQESQIADENESPASESPAPTKQKRTLLEETRRTAWMIVTCSWLNVLLVFVPAAIAVAQIDGIHGGIVFAMNCIAVIPLAGLLSHATESVASEMGDALGALLNVTFGNAVELIIFIALTKNEIRIVQASLLGSILANLLLILGMGFFLGGLRYREQVYNSTVTQMSACLLSLSVISLVLPTAFHASFRDPDLADSQSLKISRGTSVILLLVYVIYLVFQLKSHAYMYESMPQHIVDAESIPGPAAGWLDSSTSDDESSSSDSGESDQSRDTVRQRMQRMLRKGRKRRPSNASLEANVVHTEKSSVVDTEVDSPGETVSPSSLTQHQDSSGLPSPCETHESLNSEKHTGDGAGGSSTKRTCHTRKQEKAKKAFEELGVEELHLGAEETAEGTRRVDFAVSGGIAPNEGTSAVQRSQFALLRLSMKDLTPAIFAQSPGATTRTSGSSGPVPRIRYGIRRTNSLPDRLRSDLHIRPPGATLPARISMASLNAGNNDTGQVKAPDDEKLSRTAAVILLVVSTGLVALCAEFLIGSIEDVTSSSAIGDIFIGLIILPIVGNAAEHVTALTVAMKNKMDLAIGVAVGSSIQIAIFITPLVVILGWIMDRDMSLYFTLFETVCLFVSTFIVNFLVLDGRSNYLEGALLCAVYLIIAIVAFFYPQGDNAASWGGE